LRQGFLAGSSDDLKAKWKLYSTRSGQTQIEDCDKEYEQDSNEAMSDGEGSVYDKDSDEEIIARNIKRRRKEKEKKTRKQPIKKWGPKQKHKRWLG
jgi:hypothetical protein